MSDRRQHLRFDKIFTVYLTTADGMSRGIGRNISPRGMFIETREPLPLGEEIRVTLCGEDGTEMTCVCEVRYQVAISYGKKDGCPGFSRGVGLRIRAYDTRQDGILWAERQPVMH